MSEIEIEKENPYICLRVTDSTTFIIGKLSKDIYKELKTTLGYKDPTAAWKNIDPEKWDGYVTTVCYNKQWCRCSIKKDGVHFPTGLYSRAIDFFKAYSIPVTVVDDRSKFSNNKIDIRTSSSFQTRDYQQTIINDSVQRQRGIIKLATGGGKCLGKGTPVLMHDGKIKNVEDIKSGDLLMGPDSTPRKVLSTISGYDQMYRIVPKRGTPFIVNEPHILSLKMTRGSKKDGQIVNISVKDYLEKNKTFKHVAKGYRVPVDFTLKKVPLDPYFIGIWLGDGRSDSPEISSKDSEIVEYLKHFGSLHNLKLITKVYGNRCPQHAISNGRKGGVVVNSVLNSLRKLNLINNKHIPFIYKVNGKKQRLQLLAGLIDTDGSLHNGGYDYISISETLANDVAFVARSLGLKAVVSPCIKTCCNNGKKGNYYRVSISGDCSIIPVKIERKKAHVRKQKKDCLMFGFNVEKLGIDEYFGFEIDGDRLFLLGDFTVTHNTAVGAGIISSLGVAPFIFYVTSQDLLTQAKNEFEKFLTVDGKPIEIGVIGAGQCNIKDVNIMTIQTAIRALGEKFTKFDEEDEPEKISEATKSRYEAIADLIHNAKAFIADETQHWAAETCQVIADHSYNARFRFGMSATPWRDLGDDLLIDACFGRVIADINASFLIKKGILVRPTIYFVHTKKKFDDYDITYSTAYKEGIAENEERNLIIANIAQNMVKEGRNILILIKHIPHGLLLESLIPDSIFLHGSHSGKARKKHLDKMRDKKVSVTIATSIFDEGVDVKCLDGLILGGSGKSQTRALQRIGRVIRTYEDNLTGFVKKDAYVVDFHDNMKYMYTHSKARRTIYETEPEFIIKDFR